MKISIFGLGYVGCVSAACLANDGHYLIGVDINQGKVDTINAGRSPIIEPQLEQLIKVGVARRQLSATTDPYDAIQNSDVSLICVGTPSMQNGSLDLHYVKSVCEQMGLAIRRKSTKHTVVFRSTMLPGSTDTIMIPVLENTSGKRIGPNLGICYNPEFLREGEAVPDFYQPPRTVIGQFDAESGDVLERIYERVEAPVIRTDIRSAEMVKYADNAFHALKIAFANEIGSICKSFNIDSHRVMDIFVLDKKLNLSAAYLKPGWAFGGSCLPKDLRAIIHRAGELDLSVPVLESILNSNEKRKQAAFEMIRRTKVKRIGVLGLSFKENTDDLRESPAVELVETLLGKGFQVRIFDQNVSITKLVGSNRAYIDRELPHLSALMCDDPDEFLESSELVVVTHPGAQFPGLISRLRPDQYILDFVRLSTGQDGVAANYQGICW